MDSKGDILLQLRDFSEAHPLKASAPMERRHLENSSAFASLLQREKARSPMDSKRDVGKSTDTKE